MRKKPCSPYGTPHEFRTILQDKQGQHRYDVGRVEGWGRAGAGSAPQSSPATQNPASRCTHQYGMPSSSPQPTTDTRWFTPGISLNSV